MEEIHYIKNRISHILENEINGKTHSFNVNDIDRIYKQLEIEESQNEMLIKECEDLKNDNDCLRHAFDYTLSSLNKAIDILQDQDNIYAGLSDRLGHGTLQEQDYKQWEQVEQFLNTTKERALSKPAVSGQVCEHPYNLVDVRLNGEVKWCYKCNSEF